MWPLTVLARIVRRLRSWMRQVWDDELAMLPAVMAARDARPVGVAGGEPAPPTIDQLTRSPCWDYSTFRRIMIALGTAGPGVFVPAHNCPRTIDVLRWAAEAERMRVASAADGRERGSAVFADTGRGCLIIGRTHRGSSRHTRIEAAPQPGREPYQRLVGNIHIHPAKMTAHGLSGQDFESFLSEPSLRAILIAWGRHKMLVLKTSSTPKRVNQESLRRSISSSEREAQAWSTSPLVNVVVFNRIMCTEFGLTMYVGDGHSGSLLTRVQATL